MEAKGQHADGLHAYDQCRSIFAAELGCAPGPGLQAQYVRLLRGANEDDEELSLLLDAVVRLHRARRSGVQSPGHDPGTERRDTAGSVEQADRTLRQLLRGGQHPQ
jgi:DNA-binding SARP family transcriptional activator